MEPLTFQLSLNGEPPSNNVGLIAFCYAVVAALEDPSNTAKPCAVTIKEVGSPKVIYTESAVCKPKE